MSEKSSGPGRAVRQTDTFTEESDLGAYGAGYDDADTPTATDDTDSEMTANQWGDINKEVPSEQQWLDDRTITFRVYISNAVEKDFSEGKMEVRSNHGEYKLREGPGLCVMRKQHPISQGYIWEGECQMDTCAASKVNYLYGIHDPATADIKLEHVIEGHRSVKGLAKAFDVINYDGAAIFGNVKSKDTKLILKDGFHAMQPSWLDEVQGEIGLKHLLSWVDAAKDLDHVSQRFGDAEQMLKRWIKDDIIAHIKWSKELPKSPDRLFLSMVGLIYRAADLLDISEHELLSKLDKMIEETMLCNRNQRRELKQWKTWLDRSAILHKEGLLGSLEKVMNRMAAAIEPHHHWPLLIPLCHYLRGECFSTMDDDQWSLSVRATQGFEKCVTKWRSDIRQKPNCSTMLKPFLEDDPLLSYSIMELTDDYAFAKLVSEYQTKSNQTLRLDAILLRYIHCLMKKGHAVYFTWMHKQQLYDDLLKILSNLPTHKLRDIGLHWQRIPSTAKDMLNVFTNAMDLKRFVGWRNVQQALNFYLTLLDLYQRAEEPQQSQQPSSTLQNSMEALWKFVERIPPCESLPQYASLMWKSNAPEAEHALILKRWENLSLVEPANQCLLEMWNQEWKKRFSVIVGRLLALKVADSIREVKEGQYLDACTSHVVARRQYQYACFTNPTVLENLQLGVNKLVTQTWGHCSKYTNTAITIEMLKQQKKFRDICDFAHKHKVSIESERIIQQIKYATEIVMGSIVDGSCKLADFRAIQAWKKSFAEYALLTKGRQFKDSILQASTQVEEYNSFATHISDSYKSAEQLEKVKPKPDAKLSFVTRYCALDANGNGREIVQSYNKHKDFTVFQVLFKQEIAASNTVTTAVETCCEYTKQLVTSIEKGTMQVSKLQNLNQRYYVDNLDQLGKQLSSFINDQHVIDKVHMCVIDVKSHQRKARVLLKLGHMFDMKQDISQISEVARMTEREQLTMNDVNEDYLTVFGALYKANVEEHLLDWQEQSLTAFIKCPNFVSWVSINITENSIGTYAHISKDLYPLTSDQTAKAKQLLDVLNGYAPLLFHLKYCNGDLFLLHQQCKKVWASVETNPTLPSQLTQCDSELSILEKAKSSPCNALLSAREINRAGVYKIGIDTTLIKKSVSSLSIKEVLHVECPPKTLSYFELDDIQSRLALVGVGDENKTIDEFQQLKDAVKKLADVYIEIRREACVQFENLKITVYCNNENEQLVLVDFQPDQRLLGRKVEGKSNVDHCRELHEYLTRCIAEWRNHITKERRLYKGLNFYSVEQLVTLRKELSAPESDSCRQQGFPLLEMIHFQPIKPETLSAVVKECEQFDLSRSASSARKTAKLTDKQRDNIQELRRNFIRTSDEDIIDAVLEKGDVAVVVSGLDFYSEYFEKLKKSRKQGAASFSDALKADIANTQDEQSLQKRLNSLWRTLTDHTYKSIQDLLSLRHLAVVLQKLKADDEAPTTSIHFPSWLAKGRPALVGIPSGETCQFVMSLYSKSACATYPTRNEVIFCDSDTSTAKAEIFMSRALSDDPSCYCMVNCHVLKYEVCQKIAKAISSKGGGGYGLVFVYDESEKKCSIKSCLDKFFVRPTQITEESESKVKDQLQQAFAKIFHSAEDASTGVNLDRHFVRLIRSKRAGVGKTLKCENLIRKLKAENELVRTVTISIHKNVDTDKIVERLIEKLPRDENRNAPTVIHIDIAPEVTAGVDELLFNLLILRSLPHSDGKIWQTRSNHFYFVECTVLPVSEGNGKTRPELLQLLCATDCFSPKEVYANHVQQQRHLKCFDETVMVKDFDKRIHKLPEWQLALKTLSWYDGSASYFNPDRQKDEDVPYESLEALIRNCGIYDPSWSELANFVKFLSFQISNVQMYPDCAQGSFTKDLPGIARFLVCFAVNMAKDFATHSLRSAEQTPGMVSSASTDSREDNLPLFKPTKEWEKHDYPYLFFKENGKTFDTLGVFPTRSRTDPNRVHLCKRKLMDGDESYSIPFDLYIRLRDEHLLPELNRHDFEGNKSGPETRRKNCQKVQDIMAASTSYRGVQQDRGRSPMFEYEEVDENYVLTQDNAKKILAIYTRLTTDMPVIIMGETGCGKTRLVEFMTKLQIPAPLKKVVEHADVLKIHSGTEVDDIVEAVEKADRLARLNQRKIMDYAKRQKIQVPRIYTVLFFDEFNTTEEIGLIKEIMCDHRINGEQLKTHPNLKFIAACNPYRWLDEKMIENIGFGGLGFIEGKSTEETQKRRLAYQVLPMPESLKSLVWDFGTLHTSKGPSNNVELRYIEGIVERMKHVNPGDEMQFFPLERELSELIAMAQRFMREHQDECCFASLRDVERLLVVSNWFHKQRRHLFHAIDLINESPISPGASLRSIMLALGVCYMSRLKSDRHTRFARYIGLKIEQIMSDRRIISGASILLRQIELCKKVFAKEVLEYALLPDEISGNQQVPHEALSMQQCTTSGHPLLDSFPQSDQHQIGSLTAVPHSVSSTVTKHFEEVNEPSASVSSAVKTGSKSFQHSTIANSKLLQDNLFMMIPCFDMRIPLFVVGKPGTSKSLANSLIARCMLGDKSKSSMFREMKYMFQEPFQCSRHTTPKQIANALEQCRSYQRRNKTECFVSVALFDEIGLAENSDQNPLKILHELLETSCYGEKDSPEKCGFIGVSNYALDAAKMNRGLFLQLEPPDAKELCLFACHILRPLGADALEYVPCLAKGHLDVCRLLKPYTDETEFFGLRDFYSFVKMIAHFGKFSKAILEYSIRRNFGGFVAPTEHRDPVHIFLNRCQKLPPSLEDSVSLPSTYEECVKSSLFDDHTKGLETRYTMIISENIGFLSVLLDLLHYKWDTDTRLSKVSDDRRNKGKPEVIFGKAFEDDNSYTQVCRNVYKIRLCMETGKTVILLDVDDLHEGLYHLLNQSFYKWQGKWCVDLGIGIHRVPALVHDDFRLLLVAGRDEAYSKSKFPTPLINRFEKHYMSAATFLDSKQKAVQEYLHRWMKVFEEPPEEESRAHTGKQDRELISFLIGYNSEMTALIVQRASRIRNEQTGTANELVTALELSKRLLLQCATAEAVLCLGKPKPYSEAAEVQQIYTEEQKHDNLLQYLQRELRESSLLIQVTTFAEVMNKVDIEDLEAALAKEGKVIKLKSMILTKFRQEVVFRKELRKYYDAATGQDCRILIIQCESANDHTKLLDYVRYILQDQYEVKSTHTILLLSLTRGQRFNSYQGGAWTCVHIDDPKSHPFTLPPLRVCMEKKPFELIELQHKDDEKDPRRGMEPDCAAEAYLPPLKEAEQKRVFPDLIEFIKWSLPQALSKIRSQHEEKHNRAKILASLLEGEGERRQDFREQFLMHLRTLLEKQNWLNESSCHWALRAVDSSNMKKAETVRQALVNTLEQEFRPALAVVIASIDPHRNLKLLDSVDGDIAKLWLELFQLSQEIGLSCDQSLPQGIKMFHVGDENEMMFDVAFPFSWKVKEVIERLSDEGHETDTYGRQLSKRFYKDRIGRLLTEVVADRKKTLLQAYLHDLIYLCHSSKPVPGEFKIIQYLISKDLENNFPTNYGIPQIHIAYKRAETSKHCLTNMAAVLNLQPALAAQLNDEILESASVKRVDIIALRALVNELSGVKTDELVKDPEHWISEVDQCKSLTEVIIGTGMCSTQVDKKYRLNVQILEFKKLYVKHVIMPAKPDDDNIKKSYQLPSIVEDVGGYHKWKAFRYVVERMKTILKYYSKNAQDSASDKEQFEEIRLRINDFFMAFARSMLVFTPSICPESEVLDWLSKFATFRSQEQFEMLECEDSADRSSMLLYSDPALLKCYFSCLGHPTMQHHFDFAISGLNQRCTNAENHLTVLKTLIRCHQEVMGQADTDFTVKEYSELREGWKNPTLDAVQKISSLQMLITSSVEHIYQTSGTVTYRSNQTIKLLKVTSSAGDLQPGYLAPRKILSVYGESFAIEFLNSSGSSVIPKPTRNSFSAYTVPDIHEAFGDNVFQIAKNWLIQLSMKSEVKTSEIQTCIRADTAAVLQAIFTTAIWKKQKLNTTFVSKLVAAMARNPTHVTLFLQRLLKTSDWPAELGVNQVKGTLTSILVLHMFNSTAICKPSADNFPFHRIITEPEKTMNDLLPTMPNGPLDNLLKRPGVQQESLDDMDYLCIYVCPLGHPFIIEQNFKHCSVCKPVSDEESDRQMVFSTLLRETGEVKSKSGHILGAASTRSESAKRVRQLSPLSCAVLRCLTHLSMLASSLIYPDKVGKMIQPEVADNTTAPFLDAHIWTDLSQISKCCGESIENCILLLHHILHELGRAHGDKSTPNLTDVTVREQWERKFDLNYIQPTFKEKEVNIDLLKKRMASDVGTQCSKMLKELLSTNDESTAGQYILMDKSLWEYEPVTTVEYLLSMLPATVQVHPAIKALIEGYEVLRALKDLPKILKLANIMSEKFHGKLNRIDASKLKMRNFIDEHIASFQMPKDELMSLVNSYISAWNACALSSFHVGFVDASKKSLESMVIEFLLDNDNMLLCHPLNLIRCLSDAQNHLLSLMTADAATDSKDSAISELELSKVAPSQLLHVPNKDLIHQLLSKMYQHSEDGSTDHDFTSMQSCVLSDIVGNRKPILLKIDDVPFYKFEEDFQLWKQVELLSHNQEKMPEQLQVSISEVVRLSNQLLNEDIKLLENVINQIFAMSQYKPEMKLSELLVMLCMDIPTYLGEEGSQMRQYVKVKHVLHIWLLLKYSQVDLFMEHHENQDPFDDVHENYRDKGPKDIKELVRMEFQPRHYRTREFLVHLFEFITLRLNKGVSRNNAKSENPKKPLGDALKQFLRRQNLANDNQVIARFPDLSPQLLVSHAPCMWFLVWQRCFK